MTKIVVENLHCESHNNNQFISEEVKLYHVSSSAPGEERFASQITSSYFIASFLFFNHLSEPLKIMQSQGRVVYQI